MADYPTDASCLFCKIIAGEIPCYKIYEDDHVLGFLDINPIAPGHALVIPKPHAVTLDRLDEAASAACGRVLPQLSAAVLRAVNAEAFNILQNNGAAAHQAVGHVHFHIIPKTADAGLGIQWPSGRLEADDAARLHEAICQAM